MQTKSEIQRILASFGLRTNKKLGQNFLIDLNLMRLFIGKANITRDDVVIEVGPGTGSMTETLAELAGYVIAVEYDRGLYEAVRKVTGRFPNVDVIGGDVLKNQNALNPELVEAVEKVRGGYSGRLLLVSNLPYDVSSALIINLIVGEVTVDEMFMTVQKEIGEKLAANPGDELYGTLSVYVQAFGQAEIFHKLGPKVFWPEPKVDSVMLEFRRVKEKAEAIKDVRTFQQVVGMFFQHRRKTLNGCTKFAPESFAGVDWKGAFEGLGIELGLRPGDLMAEDFVEISNSVHNQLDN